MRAPEFTAEEQALIAKYRNAYWRLEVGKAEANTPARRHFLDVCRGLAPPETPHEHAWMKFKSAELAEAEAKRHASTKSLQERARLENERVDIADHEDGFPDGDWGGPANWKTPSYLGR